ncbi:MAG: septum formation protein Maf [Candidatus Omnitrophica bacterium]|nr:septum formation protein Maf [Candidatus Omnitrophota bacterium]MBU4149843.1 septum formation protein Maf [Candidatus Omnitrophota bacterium]
MNIILASASKRRSSILDSCGIRHRVVVSGIKEKMKGAKPGYLAAVNARLKAENVSRKLKNGFIIGADTVVLLGKKITGKPRNAVHARKMLKSMAGKTISVYTGLCVMDAATGRSAAGWERSKVRVKKIKPQDMSRYFKLLRPYDKAGGFSIEGAGSFIFDNIEGSYFNVLGLPMAKLYGLFKKLDADLLDIVRE